MAVDRVYLKRPSFEIRKLGAALSNTKSKSDFPDWKINIWDLEIEQGAFAFHNDWREPIPIIGPSMNYKHIQLQDIGLQLRNISLDSMLTAQVRELQLRSSSGFAIERAEVSRLEISETSMALNNFTLLTNDSEIHDTLQLQFESFESFEDFNDKVSIDARLNKTSISARDIMALVPNLWKNKFFAENGDRLMKVSGKIFGKVNNLRGQDLRISLDQQVLFEGKFSSRDIAKKGEEYLSLDVSKLQTSFETIHSLFPKFKATPELKKLGIFSFKGRFDGFFNNFVTFGSFTTPYGLAKLDMNMDLSPGFDKAVYSGSFGLDQFNLGTWLGQKDMGKVTLQAQVKEGSGLTAETARAKLEAVIQSFEFKAYTYKNARINGALNKNLFDGNFDISDQNIDMHFNGKLQFLKEKGTIVDFKARVNQMNLKALNLYKDSLSVSADFDMNMDFKSLADLSGRGLIRNIYLVNQTKTPFYLDSVSLSALFIKGGGKQLSFNSSIAKGSIEGSFDIEQLPSTLLSLAHAYHPAIAKKFALKIPERAARFNDFTFQFRIDDTENLNSFVKLPFERLKDVDAKGSFYNRGTNANVFDLRVSTPLLALNSIYLRDINIDIKGKDSTIDLSLASTLTDSLGSRLDPILVNAKLDADAMEFGINVDSLFHKIRDLDVKGNVLVGEDAFDLSFEKAKFSVFDSLWQIAEDNRLTIGTDYFVADNFTLASTLGSITLLSMRNKNLTLALENIDISMVNPFLEGEPWRFGGKARGELQAGNIFDLKDLQASLDISDFEINGNPRGILEIQVKMEDLKSPAAVNLSLFNENSDIYLKGHYYPPTLAGTGYPVDYFDFDVGCTNLPLKIFQDIFLENAISNTIGEVDGDFQLYGNLKKLGILGQAKVFNGATTVNYLGTRYHFDKQVVNLTSNIIDFSGVKIYDEFGNEAEVTGGIIHNYLKKFGLDVRLRSPKVMILNTTKKDNPAYYGKAIGQVDAKFTGSFKKTDISIQARTGPDTHLEIPIVSSADLSDLSYITFVKHDSLAHESHKRVQKSVNGISFEMDLEITEDAEVLLIFDEKAGDIIKGVGTGNIRMEMPRGGNISMFGRYQITEGDYLFTLFNALVTKPFEIQNGGTIIWNGSPFEAQLDITAQLKGLTAAPYDLILEYLNEPNIKANARKPTNVDLLMHLRGPLLSPDISFNLAFPNVSGELQTYLTAKINALNLDPNDMNRQVFGLIVFGGFVPSNNAGLLTDAALKTSGINTVSTFLSSQLSLFMSNFLADALKDVGYISGVDFNINYNVYQAGQDKIDGADLNQSGSEFSVRMNNRLFNDRLSINAGVVSGDATTGGSYVAGDFVIEYYLTEDRRYKIQFYNRSDQTFEGRRNTTALGLSYRKEFDSLYEFLHGAKKAVQEIK
ncbi:MAG: translocation/assembly module TamB domain-containing protein [Saprospiraceae bacterium]